MRAPTAQRDDGGTKLYLYICSLSCCLLGSSIDQLLLKRFQPVQRRAAKQSGLVYSVHVVHRICPTKCNKVITCYNLPVPFVNKVDKYFILIFKLLVSEVLILHVSAHDLLALSAITFGRFQLC